MGSSLRISRLSVTDIRLDRAPATGADGYNVWRSGKPSLADPETVGHTAETFLQESGLLEEVDTRELLKQIEGIPTGSEE